MVDLLLANQAAIRHGIVLRRKAREAGISDRQFDLRIEQGVLRPVHEGVYRAELAPLFLSSAA